MEKVPIKSCGFCWSAPLVDMWYLQYLLQNVHKSGEFLEIQTKVHRVSHSCLTGVAPFNNCNISLKMYRPWDSMTSSDVLKILWNKHKNLLVSNVSLSFIFIHYPHCNIYKRWLVISFMHIHTEKRERRHILSSSARFWHMARIVVDSSLASYLALSSWTQLFR